MTRRLHRPEARARIDQLEQERLEQEWLEAQRMAKERALRRGEWREAFGGLTFSFSFDESGMPTVSEILSAVDLTRRTGQDDDDKSPLEAKREREQQYVQQFKEPWRR